MKSKCCNAPMKEAGSPDFGDGSPNDIHTMHWECEKCGLPCDPQPTQDWKEEKVKEFFEKFPHLYGSLYSDWIRETIATAEERGVESGLAQGAVRATVACVRHEEALQEAKQAGREEVIAELENEKILGKNLNAQDIGWNDCIKYLISKFTP